MLFGDFDLSQSRPAPLSVPQVCLLSRSLALGLLNIW